MGNKPAHQNYSYGQPTQIPPSTQIQTKTPPSSLPVHPPQSALPIPINSSNNQKTPSNNQQTPSKSQQTEQFIQQNACQGYMFDLQSKQIFELMYNSTDVSLLMMNNGKRSSSNLIKNESSSYEFVDQIMCKYVLVSNQTKLNTSTACYTQLNDWIQSCQSQSLNSKEFWTHFQTCLNKYENPMKLLLKFYETVLKINGFHGYINHDGFKNGFKYIKNVLIELFKMEILYNKQQQLFIFKFNYNNFEQPLRPLSMTELFYSASQQYESKEELGGVLEPNSMLQYQQLNLVNEFYQQIAKQPQIQRSAIQEDYFQLQSQSQNIQQQQQHLKVECQMIQAILKVGFIHGMTGVYASSTLESLFRQNIPYTDLVSNQCTPDSVIYFWWNLRSHYNPQIEKIYQYARTIREHQANEIRNKLSQIILVSTEAIQKEQNLTVHDPLIIIDLQFMDIKQIIVSLKGVKQVYNYVYNL